VEESGEAVEVEVESAIHQCGQSPIPQFPFLFGTEEQVIQLVGERISGILLEERLKRSFPVLFVGNGKFAFQTQRTGEGGLANSAGTDDNDERVHGLIIRDNAHPLFAFASYNWRRSNFMKQPIILMPDDPLLDSLNFKPHRNMIARRVTPFVPEDGQPQTMDVITPWGAVLTAKKGDLLVSELDRPDDVWPIDSRIFEETYIVTSPGFCVKRAITMLVPLTDVTGGDEDRMVTIHALEGPITVRAGDFLLAKGVMGEIWPYPKEKAAGVMKPVR
jgi:hypothetical protein